MHLHTYTCRIVKLNVLCLKNTSVTSSPPMAIPVKPEYSKLLMSYTVKLISLLLSLQMHPMMLSIVCLKASVCLFMGVFYGIFHHLLCQHSMLPGGNAFADYLTYHQGLMDIFCICYVVMIQWRSKFIADFLTLCFPVIIVKTV